MGSARRVALVFVLVLAGACSSDAVSDDQVGECKFEPGTVCRDQDLQHVSFVGADLQGADFSGSNLSNADLRDADLSGAKMVGTVLGGTNLAGANLTNADLTRAFMAFTNLTDAELGGAIQAGAQRCQVTEPDGSFTIGSVLDAEGRPVPCVGGAAATTTTLGARSTGAPRVEYFRLAKPERCITDVAGTGVDIEWWVPNAMSMTFYVDGIRIESATRAKGTKRVPFVCNGEPHIVAVQAFGASEPNAGSTFIATLEPSAPLSPDD